MYASDGGDKIFGNTWINCHLDHQQASDGESICSHAGHGFQVASQIGVRDSALGERNRAIRHHDNAFSSIHLTGIVRNQLFTIPRVRLGSDLEVAYEGSALTKL